MCRSTRGNWRTDFRESPSLRAIHDLLCHPDTPAGGRAMPTPVVPISCRVTPKTHERVARVAKERECSLNAAVQHLLGLGLQVSEATRPKPESVAEDCEESATPPPGDVAGGPQSRRRAGKDAGGSPRPWGSSAQIRQMT